MRERNRDSSCIRGKMRENMHFAESIQSGGDLKNKFAPPFPPAISRKNQIFPLFLSFSSWNIELVDFKTDWIEFACVPGWGFSVFPLHTSSRCYTLFPLPSCFNLISIGRVPVTHSPIQSAWALIAVKRHEWWRNWPGKNVERANSPYFREKQPQISRVDFSTYELGSCGGKAPQLPSSHLSNVQNPVSYTHLTLPTKA